MFLANPYIIVFDTNSCVDEQISGAYYRAQRQHHPFTSYCIACLPDPYVGTFLLPGQVTHPYIIHILILQQKTSSMRGGCIRVCGLTWKQECLIPLPLVIPQGGYVKAFQIYGAYKQSPPLGQNSSFDV